MNQPNLPVTAPRANTAPEAADMLVLLRRYALLLIAGTVLGTAGGLGLYFYTLHYEPRYTASVPYQVLPPQNKAGERNMLQIIQQSSEEVSQLIHRQELVFEQESFLDDVTQSAPFHTDRTSPLTAGSSESQWLRDNKKNLMRAIKRDLRIVPKVNAAAFEITMTAKDPYEAFALVKAASDVYQNRMMHEMSMQQNLRLKSLKEARDKAESAFHQASDTLSAWARARDVDVQRTRYEVEKSGLQQLTEESIRVNALSVLANAQLGTIKSILAPVLDSAGETMDQGKREEIMKQPGMDLLKFKDVLRLTPETENLIENDPTLRGLDSQRLSWEQEQQAELGKPTPNGTRLKEIKDRLKKIADQKDVERDRLRWEAAERMLKNAQDDANSKLALAKDVDLKRGEKNTIVLTIGQALMEYQQKSDDVKSKEDLMYKVGEEYNIALVNSGSDDQRVQPMADPMIPSEVSSPRWFGYVPPGTILGLGLSSLLAYVLFITDKLVRTPRDITRGLQLSLLGFVPDESDDRTLTGDVETAILSSPGSMVAESFRQIRSHIMAQTAHNPVNTLLVASITPGGGATTVAANLAAAMALNEMRVLLIDANFYRPGISRVFQDVPASGFANALADPENFEDSIVPHPSLPKLHIMGAGSELGGASSEMFEGKAFRDLIDRLKSRYDMIIFDGAPLNLVSDSLALAARVDGLVSVVRADDVSRGTVARVRDQLRNVHANLLGFVLNAVQTNNSGYFKENYRTFYRYAGKNRRTGQKLLGS